MHLQRSQRGATLATVAFILLLIGFVVYVALKLIPVYMEDMSLTSALDVVQSDKTQVHRGAMDVRTAIFKQMSMNNITQVTPDDISVERDTRIYLVDIDYEVRIPFFKNIDLAVSFKHHAELDAP